MAAQFMRSSCHSAPSARRWSFVRKIHRRRVGAVVVSCSLIAVSMSVSESAHASLNVPVDFGSQIVGTTSAPLSVIVPLATTVGETRADLVSAINASTFSDEVIPIINVTVTGQQIQQAFLDAIAALSDATVLSIRIDGLELATGTDFAIGGDCVGADGATQNSCTADATFTPIAAGPRSDALSVQASLTQGFDAIETAFQQALASDFGFLGEVVAAVLPLIAPSLLNVVESAYADQLNPIAALSGVGIPTISVAGSPQIREGDTGTTIAQVPVHLSAPSPTSVSVDFATMDGTAKVANLDYRETHGTLVFLPGQTDAAIGVRIVGDTRLEGNETFTVTLSTPDGAALGSATSTVTILNDDIPNVRLQGSSVPEGAPAHFAIRLSQPYYADLTLQYRTNDGTATAGSGDYLPVADAVVTIPAETQGPAIVSIPTLVDHTVEASESFTLTVTGGRATVTKISYIKANTT
jgi:Calx-beta domain